MYKQQALARREQSVTCGWSGGEEVQRGSPDCIGVCKKIQTHDGRTRYTRHRPREMTSTCAKPTTEANRDIPVNGCHYLFCILSDPHQLMHEPSMFLGISRKVSIQRLDKLEHRRCELLHLALPMSELRPHWPNQLPQMCLHVALGCWLFSSCIF